MIYSKWEKRDLCKNISQVSARNFGEKDLEITSAWDKKFKENGYHIHNIDKAASFVTDCIKDGYEFAVLGDYDTDGITGTVILARGLMSLGVSLKKVQIVIPDRLTEDYGAKPMHIDRIRGDKVCLIFVDNGINADAALKRAKERGLKSVILDHHTATAVSRNVLSLADVVVDPEAEEALCGNSLSDFTFYCGAGLAFSLMRHMNVAGKVLNKLLTFAAIGTVGDVVPLREENFCFVKYALPLITNEAIAPAGLSALTYALNLYGARLSAKNIAFSYSPVINAQSRMRGRDGVIDVVKLFLYDGDFSRKIAAAEKLIEVNTERKRIQNTACLLAERILDEEGLKNARPLILYIPGINEGIVGIIAGKLAEKYHTPTIVFTDAVDEGIIKGSGRSAGNYDMTKAIELARPLLLSGGGHPGACGLKMRLENLDTLKKTLSDAFPSDYSCKDEDTLYYDLEIDANDIDKTLPIVLKRGPYGEGHGDIVFKINGFALLPAPQYVNVLSDQKSVRLNGYKASAFCYDMVSNIPRDMKKADIIGVLTENYYRGKGSIQIEVLDIKDTTEEITYKETPLAEKIRQMG